MGQDTTILGETVTALGKLSTDRGNITSDGVNGNLTAVGLTGTNSTLTNSTITTGTVTTLTSTTANITNAVTTNQYGGVSGTTGVALTTAGTIAYARVTKVNPGSAVTAVIMASGTQDGQELTIMNTAAAAGSSVTFATAGTAAASSHLATDFVISGLTCAKFVWDGTTTLWYPVVN